MIDRRIGRWRFPIAAAFTAAAIAVALTSTPSPTEGAARCPPPDSRPEVTLSTKLGTMVFNTGHSRQQLRRLKENRSRSRVGAGWVPIGLTLTELRLQMNIRVNAMPDGRGRFCASLDSVNASIGYDKLMVYVARKYRRGSCQYNSIVGHERGHVAIFRDTLDRYRPRIEGRLRRTAARLGTISVRTPKQGASRMQRSLEREMEPLFREINRALDRANSRLDTPQNYQREQANCPSW
jgi:hypothetical protein